MGTNYYYHEAVCPHCGRSDEPLHIGKSSAGWCFSLHVIPERGLNSLEDWKRLIVPGQGVIRNEYGEDVTVCDLLEIIEKREWADRVGHVPFGYASWTDFHRQNYSQPGPNGLVRHVIGDRCIGHGEGMWDLIVGEFS